MMSHAALPDVAGPEREGAEGSPGGGGAAEGRLAAGAPPAVPGGPGAGDGLREAVAADAGQLRGGHDPPGVSTIFLSAADGPLGQRESVPDFARTLSRYVDAVVLRTFHQSTVEERPQHHPVDVADQRS